MKQLVFVVSIVCFLTSCGSKRTIVTKKSKANKNTERIVEQKDVITTTEEVEVNTNKTYANATERYIDTYKGIAKNEMKLYNIPASITLAQGILESGSGKGTLSTKANNHFGIKCHDWTGAKVYHDDDRAQECFRKYKHAKYSFRDHSLFLSERKRYAALFKLKKSNYKGWAKGLKAAGYATDKKYPQKLISLIERYKLYEYDKEVLGNSYEPYIVPQAQTGHSYKVVKGDTLYSISKRYNLTVEELQRLNGLHGTEISIGQELQVSKN